MEQVKHPYEGIKRLPRTPNSFEEAIQYFATRARQMLPFECVWTEAVSEYSFGYVTYFNYEGKIVAGIVQDSTSATTCYEVMNFIDSTDTKYFFDFGGQIGHAGIGKKFLDTPGYDHFVQYKAIEQFYGDKRATRSGVLLMNHIDEGVAVISRAARLMPQYAEADFGHAITAFCLHPMFQSNDEIRNIVEERVFLAETCHPVDLVYATEYRSVANANLSDHWDVPGYAIQLSPIPEVNLMLIGDKVQNYKDFLTYHSETHPRAKELTAYFQNWLDALGINAGLYHKLVKHIPSV